MSVVRIAPAHIVIVSGVVAALHIGKVAPAIPVLQASLGMSLVEAGFLLSLIQFAGMIAGGLIGVANDRFGPRRSLLLGQATLCLASLAGMYARGPTDLLVARAVEGFGFLLTVLPGPALIRQLVAPDRLALHLGLWGTYMPAGTTLAFVGGPLVMPVLGWPGLWGLLGLLSAGTAAWVYLRVPADAQQRGAAQSTAEAGSWIRNLRITLGSIEPWRIALSFATYSSQWIAVIGFLPSIYAKAGLSGQLAGALTALASVVNVIGNIAAGRLMHRAVRPRQLLYAGFLTMAIATFVAFVPWTDGAPAVRYVAVIAFSMIGGIIPATLFMLAVEAAPDERTVSTTVGWMQQISSTGQFLGPPLVAWVASRVGGWHWTWAVTGGACAIGLLLARGAGRAKEAARAGAAGPAGRA